jgi:hypothetical protein
LKAEYSFKDKYGDSGSAGMTTVMGVAWMGLSYRKRDLL